MDWDGKDRRKKNTLTEDDIDRIVSKMSEKMTVINFCPLDEKNKKAALKWYSILDSFGDGDAEAGARKLQKNFLFLESVYEKRNVAVGAGVIVFVSGAVGLVGKIILDWIGK